MPPRSSRFGPEEAGREALETGGEALPQTTPDVLGFIFAPQKARGRVKTAKQMTSRARQSEVNAFMRANPGVTRQQAQRRTAALRRRGYIPRTIRTEQATPEQQQRAAEYQARSQRSSAAAQRRQPALLPLQYMTDDELRGLAAESMYNKVGPGSLPAEFQQQYEAGTAGAWKWNEAVVLYNIGFMTRDELIWTIQASADDIRNQASVSARARQFSPWFYHSDGFMIVAA